MAAFALYHATLLPGVDLGDTASFQVVAGSRVVTPRDGYPLYFALGDLLLAATGVEPARALNLASALEAAAACALVVWVAAELAGSLAAAVAAALLFAGSYTFWSQAIIAEVYALHMLFVALTIGLALRWGNAPSPGRLAAFFAAYALGFGNHLSMVLLCPGFTVYLLIAAPGGWRTMVRPRIVAVAVLCAVVGALQYAWNLHALWLQPNPPASLAVALQQFWFDVTKTDWRETMVMNVPRALVGNHLAMYAFDLHQQFGWAGPALATLGLTKLVTTDWRRGVLLFTLYAVNVVFAFDYNVGDTHVFYLPSHLIIALLAAPGLTAVGTLVGQRRLAAAALAAYAALRVWRDYPALDRSRDTRPTQLLAQLTADLDDRHALLLTDLNWQVENGLTYFTKRVRPEVATLRMPAAILYLPALVAENAAIGRKVVATSAAERTAEAAYGPLLSIAPDPRAPAPRLSRAAAVFPPGARYVLCVLKPTRDFALDVDDVGRAVGALTGGRLRALPDGDYVAIAGRAGRAPDAVLHGDRPFARTVSLDGTGVTIRMEAWLAADTIRRMGFGQVVAGRTHTLIVERGVSLVAFTSEGTPTSTTYAANIFSPQPRFLIQLAP